MFHGNAIEVQLLAQQVAQDRAREAGRQVAVLAGKREVAGQDHPGTRLEGRPKRDELMVGQLGARPCHLRQLVVGISRRAPATREVLGSRCDALALQATDGRRGQLRHRPRIVAEFEDSALMKAFGAAGAGVFVVPAVVASDLCARQNLVELGRSDDIRERFYALAGSRRDGHPGVQAVLESARSRVFAEA